MVELRQATLRGQCREIGACLIDPGRLRTFDSESSLGEKSHEQGIMGLRNPGYDGVMKIRAHGVMGHS